MLEFTKKKKEGIMISKSDNNRNYKWYDRFNWAFDIIFFLPRHIVQFVKWLF